MITLTTHRMLWQDKSAQVIYPFFFMDIYQGGVCSRSNCHFLLLFIVGKKMRR